MKRILFGLLITVVAHPVFATCYFQEATASQTFLVGPFLDGTDGITAETGLTVANTDIRISKAGGNTAAKNSGGCTHDEAGMYQCTFDATDTDTTGPLQIYTDNSISSQSIVPVFHECWVVATEYYDVLDGTTEILTSRMTGLPLKTTISGVTSQTVLVLTTGPSNNDALNEQTAYFVGGTEECERRITDYTGSTTTITIEAACPFTLATTDDVYVYAGASGYGLRTAQGDLDTITGTSGAVLDTDAVDADAIAADAITGDVFSGWSGVVVESGAADSGDTNNLVDATRTEADDFWNDDYMLVVDFGPAEARCITDFAASSDQFTVTPAFTQSVGTENYAIIPAPGCLLTQTKIDTAAFIQAQFSSGVIGADQIGPNAIGASEIADNAIDAGAIAASAIGASELATDAIGADELAAGGVDEIWNEIAEDQGSTYTAREVLSLLLSEAMGTCTYTTGTRTWVCKDPSGTETRFTLVYGSELDGDRSTSTPAPVTP